MMISDSVAAVEAPLFSAAMKADPYPHYARLRAEGPVQWSEPHDAWLVTGYDAVAAGLNDLRLSSERSALFMKLAGAEELAPFFRFLSQRMNLNDPPRHTRLRALVSRAFTPHAVEAMRPHIQEVVDGLIDAALPKGRFDLIHDFSFPLPAIVIMEMLGVPPADREQFKAWSDAFVVFFSTHPSQISLEQHREALRAMQAMVAYFKAALPAIRRSERPTLLKLMSEATEHGDQLTEEELYANANLLLIAGHETTTNTIGNGMLALLRHPEELAKLKAEPKLLPTAVEEFLRFDGPVQFTHRIVKEAMTLGGQTLRPGQLVFLFLAAANRDPAHFAEPDRLDVARTPNKHLSFGLGHHFCLGSPLARLETQLAFGTLLRRLPNLRLETEQVEYGPNFNLRGLMALPVAIH